MKMVLTVEWTERDKNGKIRTISKRRSKSYVVGFLGMLATMSAGSAVVQYYDTGGTLRTLFINTGGSGSVNQMYVLAAAADSSYGVVVGTGTNTVTPTDSKLQTQIAHGTGAGQLSHGSVAIGSPSSSGTQVIITLTRTFTNNSAGDITINECGVYVKFLLTASTTCNMCMVRDKLGTPVTIATGGNSKICTYTLAFTT